MWTGNFTVGLMAFPRMLSRIIMNGTQSGNTGNGRGRFLLLLALLGGTLLLMFRQSFLPGYVLFANDGPLGAMKATQSNMPDGFLGVWQCLNWLGNEGVSAAPSVTSFMVTLFPGEIFLKIYPPLTLFFVGFSAWLFFRQLGFNGVACVLGGLAAGLNMHCCSVASWGLGSWNLAIGLIFLALAAIASKGIKQIWAKAILAGLAVGAGLMEGYDSGAIMSVYVGIFVIFYAFNQEAPVKIKVLNSIWVGALVVIFSALIATHTIVSLVQTQIKGVAVTGQIKDEADKNLSGTEKAERAAAEKDKRWRECTQWSVPKLETLRVIIPGMFGYRMAEHITIPDKSSAFWGRIGQDTHIPELESNDPAERARIATALKAPPDVVQDIQSNDMETRYRAINTIKGSTRMYQRHSGSGEFAGVLVAVLACFGLANAFRKIGSPFSMSEKRAVWFWGIAALFSLMAAWGRYGFVYQILFELPYFSTMRNPMKFMHPFHICWLILAGYGLEVLYRRYLQGPAKRTEILPEHLRRWWSKAAGFDKKWAIGMVATVVAAAAGFIILSASKSSLVWHLNHHGFSSQDAMGPLAPQIATFAIREVGLFLLFLVLSAAVVTAAVSGAWCGQQAKVATVLMAAIMIVDLGRSDLPWLRYFDYKEKYSLPPNPPNQIVQFLKDKPYEHRITSRWQSAGDYLDSHDGNFVGLLHYWLENDFQYFDIQSLDLDQAPRLPELDKNFMGAFNPKSPNDLKSIGRIWRITNTRYILANGGFAEVFNQQIEPAFRIRALFSMQDSSGGMLFKTGAAQLEDAGDLGINLNQDKGPYALIEYTNALPRAKLYANWQVVDDKTALAVLGTDEFDCARNVLIAKDTPLKQIPADTNANPGTVTITKYLPKYIQLTANVQAPAVLLLNERIADPWKAWVDGKPAPLLRCDYIMRGVFLPAGSHNIEFRFQPPLNTLYISLSAWVVGLLLPIFLFFTRRSAPSAGPVAQA